MSLFILLVSYRINSSKEAEVDFSFNNIKSKGKIVVGTYGFFKPMNFFDDNDNLVGFDIDLSNEISKRLELDLEIKTMNFSDLFDAVKEEKIDVAISGITVTAERAKTVLFSAPYLEDGQMLVVLKNNEIIKDKNDLRDKKVGVQRGSTGEEVAKYYVDAENIFPFDQKGEEKALKEGEIDAIIFDNVNVLEMIKDNEDFKTVGDLINQEYFGIMTKQGKVNLISEINKIILEMRLQGDMKRLEEKWLQ